MSNTPHLDTLFGEPKFEAQITDEQIAQFRDRFDGDWRESPSSFVQFRKCPGQWWAGRYLLPQDPSGYPAVVGTYVHRILECFYNEPAENRTAALLTRYTERARAEATGEYRDDDPLGSTPMLLEAPLLEDIKRIFAQDKWARRSFFTKAQDAIDNLRDFDDDPTHVDVIANEMTGTLHHNGVTVRGKIDRVSRTPEGAEIIEDWKTGRTPDTEHTPHVDEPTYVPVGLYLLMRQQQHSSEGRDRPIESLDLLYLASGTCVTIPGGEETERTARHVLDSTTSAMREVVESRRLPLLPSQDNCVFCPLKKVCPAKERASQRQETYSDAVHQARSDMSV